MGDGSRKFYSLSDQENSQVLFSSSITSVCIDTTISCVENETSELGTVGVFQGRMKPGAQGRIGNEMVLTNSSFHCAFPSIVGNLNPRPNSSSTSCYRFQPTRIIACCSSGSIFSPIQ